MKYIDFELSNLIGTVYEIENIYCAELIASLNSASENLAFQQDLDNLFRAITRQKDLGILISDSLFWSAHINEIRSKTYRSLYLIRQTIPCTPINVKKDPQFITCKISANLLFPAMVSQQNNGKSSTVYILNEL